RANARRQPTPPSMYENCSSYKSLPSRIHCGVFLVIVSLPNRPLANTEAGSRTAAPANRHGRWALLMVTSVVAPDRSGSMSAEDPRRQPQLWATVMITSSQSPGSSITTSSCNRDRRGHNQTNAGQPEQSQAVRPGLTISLSMYGTKAAQLEPIVASKASLTSVSCLGTVDICRWIATC